MDYKIVPMDKSHLPEVAELEKVCFSKPWTESMLGEVLYNDTASFLVALGNDGKVWGYAGLHVVLDEGYIDNVAVFPDHRRKGVADALLNVYERFGRAHLAFLTLEVRPSNKDALDLYMKHGYAQVGRRKDYYQDPKEDAVIMTLDFAPKAEMS